jgi:hypothetical protein
MKRWAKYLFAYSLAFSIVLFFSGAVAKHVDAGPQTKSVQQDAHSETVHIDVAKHLPLPTGDYWYQPKVVKDYSQIRLKFLMISVDSVTKTIFSDDDIVEFDCTSGSRKCSVSFSLTAKHELVYFVQSDFAVFANIVAFYE